MLFGEIGPNPRLGGRRGGGTGRGFETELEHRSQARLPERHLPLVSDPLNPPKQVFE